MDHARNKRHDALFEVGAYVPGEALYPAQWELRDAVRMDVVPKWSVGLMVATWPTVSAILLIHP